jgi:putative ABC transport system permease protein
MSALRYDFRYALRSLSRRPGFTAAAVLTLALGIGATTAIFSAVDHVVLRALPYGDSDRVVTLWETDTAKGEMHKEVAPGNFIAWKERSATFTAMGLAEPSGIDLTSPGAPPVMIPTWNVSEGFFEALGVRPVLGAGFQPEHYEAGGPAAVMISYDFWQRHLGGEPSVVGTTIQIDVGGAVVAGVLPPWLEYPEPKDIWTPKRYRQEELADRASNYMYAVARLASGGTAAEAQAELDTVATSLAREFPRTNGDAGVRLVPLKEEIVGGIRPAMLALLGAAALLLLIACANVAHLMLVRAGERGYELSLRACLGASRRRLARQLLIESALVTAAGGLFGIGLAAAGLEGVIALSPPDVPRIDAVTLDGRVLAGAALICLATVGIVSLLPVLRFARADAAGALRGGPRGQTSDPVGTGLRRGLVVGEIAVAVILLVGSGLLARSFVAFTAEDLGFGIEGRATAQAFIWDRNPTAEQRIARVAEIDERLEALPGVERAAVVSALPFHPTRITRLMAFDAIGRSSRPADRELLVYAASPDYFKAMQIPLLAGEMFESAANREPIDVVINETAARHFFGDESPVGRTATVADRTGSESELRIVGVVGDVRSTSFASAAEPELYIPYVNSATGSLIFLVQTDGDAAAMLPLLRRALHAVDPGQSIYFEATMEQLVSATLVTRQFQLLLIGAFSIAALVLVVVGVFGVFSYATALRTNEIGIRMAVGARAAHVLGMVLRQAFALALLGVGFGLAAAAGLTRFIGSLLYGIDATDPLTYVSVAILLGFAALLASWLPARRASRIDPTEALRSEA